MSKFVHLHVHSHYSLLDGLPKIPELINRATKLEFEALALTDHGNMYGAIEFYKNAKKAGIKPILGIEAYVALEGLLEKKPGPGANYHHLVLLAADLEGYHNLLRLTTLAHLEGYYYKPRIDKQALQTHALGLIGLSGCSGGEIPRHLSSQNFAEARKAALEYETIFGKGRFFLEIQRNARDAKTDSVQAKINQELVKLSSETQIPLVATNDAHYLDEEDKIAQDILVCVGTGKTVTDIDRLDMKAFDLSLRPQEAMSEIFSDLPEALKNSVTIAQMINLELPLERHHFPAFTVPSGYTPETHFEELCLEGLKNKYENSIIPENLLTRLKYEIDVIKNKGYATYFLVVADLINWARNRGIISTTRGSAAGSLAAYALGITTMNPLEYKLPFERFLNPYRPTPPDIDLDFADNRRDEVLEYVSEKYGKDKVAQIVTFGTMMARAAVRDVGRALGTPYSKCDRIAKMIPFGKQGFHMSIELALLSAPELKEIYDKDPETHELLELAKKVEGCARHASIHAAGMVIAPTQLTNFTPLQLDTEFKNVITQYDMHSIEAAGLVKMDLLGIRNLSILGNAVELVRQILEIDIDLQKIPLSDPKTYEFLGSGRTMGIFQLGGSGMTKYLVELRPTNIFDIMAMISLYRPGPMESIPQFIERKHHPELITYLDPRLREILDMSYGVITYQDDVLLIAIKLAGYSWEEADKLRKAMGKKIPKEMAAQKEKFIQGAINNSLASEKAVKLWSLIEPFAAYGFNKAHAASYAIVAYQTAYMKANYPVEFMAALMTAESDDMDKVAVAVAECRSLGIQVLPPDSNESLADFTVIGKDKIRFGLKAIKNLGSDVIASIIAERRQKGQFLSLADFVRRIKTRNFNKKSWEALVKSGSLDRFGERNQMLLNTEIILDYARRNQKQEALGQGMLLAGFSGGNGDLILKSAPEASDAEKLSWEKEFLGLYVSSHPLQKYREILHKSCAPLNQLGPADDGTQKTIGGIITRIQKILTKKGEQMCFADLEDLDGKLELVIFPSVFNEYRSLLEVDQIVKVTGRISDKDGELKMLADRIKNIEENVTDVTGALRPAENGNSLSGTNDPVLKIRIPQKASPQIFSSLKIAFSQHPGQTSVSLIIPDREGAPREIKTNFLVENSEAFKTRLKQLLRESLEPPPG